jgi:cellulose 1,4-beta-cellobiosidase
MFRPRARSFKVHELALTLFLACAGASSGEAHTAGSRSTPSASTSHLADPSAGLAHAPSINPFVGAHFYVDQSYAENVRAAAVAAPEQASSIEKMRAFPTGLWVYSLEDLSHAPFWLADAARQGAPNAPTIILIVISDLPNRGCSDNFRDAELKVEADGARRYREEFIDKLAEEFRRYPQLRIAAIVEPTSLAEIATNSANPQCAASERVYIDSVAYALTKLDGPNVFLYLDAASSSWTGWDPDRKRLAQVLQEVLLAAGGFDRIRGFASNIGAYNALDGDADKRILPGNPCLNELTYIQKLTKDLAKTGVVDKPFLIDTGRNGRSGMRTDAGNWCNVKGAGIGERPRAAPRPLVDAYVWAKPPGYSDGNADPMAARFAPACTSSDAEPGAPDGGVWFQSHFLELVRNANPPL